MSNWWIEEYKKFHRDINDYGNGGAMKFHHLHIDDLIKDTETETLLDFGCGKAPAASSRARALQTGDTW